MPFALLRSIFKQADTNFIKKDAKRLALKHHVVTGYIDAAKRNQGLLYNKEFVKKMQDDCDDMIDDIYFVQKDVIRGLSILNDNLQILSKFQFDADRKRWLSAVLEKVLGVTHSCFVLLRDAQKREESRRRDRLKGFLGMQVSERKEEKLERKEGKHLRKDFEEVLKSLQMLLDLLQKKKKKGNFTQLWTSLQEKLTDKFIEEVQHFFLITIDMSFDLKEGLEDFKRPDLFGKLIDDLVHIERREKKWAKKAA